MLVSSLCRAIHNTPIFARLIFSPCALNSSLHCSIASCGSRLFSYTIARSSAYRSFPSWYFTVAFLLINSSTVMNGSGLRALPCLNPMFIPNSSDTPAPMTTIRVVLSNVPYTLIVTSSPLALPSIVVLPSHHSWCYIVCLLQVNKPQSHSPLLLKSLWTSRLV